MAEEMLSNGSLMTVVDKHIPQTQQRQLRVVSFCSEAGKNGFEVARGDDRSVKNQMLQLRREWLKRCLVNFANTTSAEIQRRQAGNRQRDEELSRHVSDHDVAKYEVFQRRKLGENCLREAAAVDADGVDLAEVKKPKKRKSSWG